MRATVLGQTWMSRVASSVAIFSVVRRVQRIPVMGSPATSCCKAASMAAITSGVFFPGAAARRRGGARGHVARPRRAVACVRGLRYPPPGVETEQISDAAVTAPWPQLEGLKPGVQAALAFVEQAGEQHDSGAQLVRHEVGIRHRSDQPGGGQQGAPGAQLLRLAGAVGGAIQKLAGQFSGGSACAAGRACAGHPGCRREAGCPTPH